MNGRLERYRGELRDSLRKTGIEMVPSKALKELNPIAIQIRRKLGKGFLMISISDKGSKKEAVTETIIFPTRLENFKLPDRPFPVRTRNYLVSIQKHPGKKGMIIKVNSKFGEMGYTLKTVMKAKEAVEDVLTKKKISYSKSEHNYHIHHGRKVQFVGVESKNSFGDYNNLSNTRKVLNNMPQRKYTEFKTGKNKNPHMPYHR